MIVTRQRPKRRSFGKFVLPAVALVALIVAVAWPPSRNAIVGGPLKPVFGVLGSVAGGIARPFTFVAQQEAITEKNREIVKRDQQLEAERRRAEAADAKAKSLQSQLSSLQNEPVATAATAAPVPRATASPAAMALGANSGTGSASDEIKRDAQVWANMEPEKAAALVRKLPDDQVAAIFAQMSPDAVGPIMEALPADVAARITQVQGVRTVH